MENFEGKLIEIKGKPYRVYYQEGFYCFLIEYNSIAFRPMVITSTVIREMMENEEAGLCEDQHTVFVDPSYIESLDENKKANIERDKAFIREVEEHTGPSFLKVSGKKPKPWFVEIYKKYGIAKQRAFWLINKYLKSNPKENAFLDLRHFNGEVRLYKKSGRKTDEGNSPYSVESQDLENMEEAVNALKSGKYRSIHDGYIWLVDQFYSTKISVPVVMGSQENFIKRPLPPGQRVSEKQFRTYLANRKEELKEAKMGIESYRNNCRRIVGRPSDECPYPGYLVEVDALDVDLNIVSEYDRNKSVSRPTIYAMRDVLTGMILAISVCLEKNSVLGVSRLVMNLLQDKVELAASFGIKLDPASWPSFVCPAAWRTDHGSDFMAKALEDALVSIGVRKESAPPRTGSYKGKIESLFNVFYTKNKPLLEGHGLISKEYKGNDIAGSCLTITGLWEVAVRFAIWFNEHVYKSAERKIDPKMMKDPDATNTSAFLWKYCVEHYGEPKHFSESTRTQLLFNLMEPVKYSFQRDGIHVGKLVYNEEDDKDLAYKIITGAKADMVFRRDPGNIGNIFYMNEETGRIARCTLNCSRSGDDFMVNSLDGTKRYMTWDEYDDFVKAERKMKKADKEKSIFQEIEYDKKTSAAIQAYSKPTISSGKDMRKNQKLEKQEDNSRNTFTQLIEKPEEKKVEQISEAPVDITPPVNTVIPENADPFSSMLALLDANI